MKTTIQKLSALLLALALCFTGVSALAEASKLTVAVTILPQKALVEGVAQGLADVLVIVPAGSSPGNYEPTPMEMEAFSKASVYFTIGVPTEEANILPSATDMTVVDLPTLVAAAYPDRTFPSGGRDPHIWLSPKRAIVMVNAIADTLAQVDAANADTYKANAQSYVAELTELDQYIAAAFDGMVSKAFIAYHPAYGYLADDYGLTMYSLEENGKEATPEKMMELVDLAKEKGLTTVFSQAEIDSKQPDAFAEEIGGTKVMLAPLAENYIENLTSMADAIAASAK
jgi:zinc transport system substrate-binding protein